MRGIVQRVHSKSVPPYQLASDSIEILSRDHVFGRVRTKLSVLGGLTQFSLIESDLSNCSFGGEVRPVANE